MCIYIYIYISISLSLYIYIYIYVSYTHITLYGEVAFKLVRPGQFGGEAEPGAAAKLLSEFLGTFILVLGPGGH